MAADANAQDDHDDRDHAQAMIDWLADKDPEIWLEVAGHLNWDNSIRVLDWIISQPQCDKAAAACIFWGAEPLYHIRHIAAGETPAGEGFDLLEKVLRNWKAGFYTRAELAWYEDWRGKYGETIAALAGTSDPLSIPGDLLGPLPGRPPNIPDDMRAENNVVLYDLLYNLGTSVGWRPGSDQWHEYRDPERRRKAARKRELSFQRAGIWYIAKDIFGFWCRAAYWMALPSVLILAVAVVLRWMVKGVVF